MQWEKKCAESKVFSSDSYASGLDLSQDIHNDFSYENRNTSVETSILSFDKNFSPNVQPLQNHTIDLEKRFKANYTETASCSSSSNGPVRLFFVSGNHVISAFLNELWSSNRIA